MIDSVRERRQCMLDFYSHYERLCAVQGSVPLKAVKADLNWGALNLTVDSTKAADWAPLLIAVEVRVLLCPIAFRSFHQWGLEESDLTGQLCKAVKGCPSISDVLKNLELQELLLRERERERESDLILLTKGTQSVCAEQFGCLGLFSILICLGVKNSGSIRYINFTGYSLTWQGAKHMTNVLKHQAMKRHKAAWAERLCYRRPDLGCMTGLRHVAFNCNMLVGDRGASAFAECLGEDLWLKALDSQQCGISNKGAKSLFDALQDNIMLVVLDIRKKNPLIGTVKRGNSLGNFHILRVHSTQDTCFIFIKLELGERLLKLKEERRVRVKVEEWIMELEIENARLKNLNISLSEVLHAQLVTNMILEDEGVLGSIENSFQKFHAFLDLLKDAGLGQLSCYSKFFKNTMNFKNEIVVMKSCLFENRFKLKYFGLVRLFSQY
nr:PREDICTED: centrosomal protein of 78 kDa-like [Struthio camelus australis]